MAGYMYLGSQRVCPAVVSGGSEPTEYFTIKLPDSLKVLNFEGNVFSGQSVSYSGVGFPTIVFDFNKLEEVTSSGDLGMPLNSYKGNVIIKNIESLKVISGNFLQGFCDDATLASGHGDINFENLEEIGWMCMYNSFGMSGVTSIRFKKLTTIGSEGLYALLQGINSDGSTGVHVYFDAVNSTTFEDEDECLSGIFDGTSDCTLHFPSNVQEYVEELIGYPNFGGTNTTILYDLEPTEN